MNHEQDQKPAAETAAESVDQTGRALAVAYRFWRPAATAVCVLLALWLAWGVVYGRHGLIVWHNKRAEERQLLEEIRSLQQENAHLQRHVERLRNDPDAIEHEAREKLHYTRPGEVIYTLPAPQNR